MTTADLTELLHTIRLHGPWELQPMGRTQRLVDGTIVEIAGSLPPSCQQKIPADWSESLGADFRGSVLYSRAFGHPTGLTPRDRIFIVIEGADAFADVELNGELIGQIAVGGAIWCCNVTDRLSIRNRLMVRVHLPLADETTDVFHRGQRAGLPGGLIGSVRLEICRVYCS